jgi:hypothetical protein
MGANELLRQAIAKGYRDVAILDGLYGQAAGNFPCQIPPRRHRQQAKHTLGGS